MQLPGLKYLSLMRLMSAVTLVVCGAQESAANPVIMTHPAYITSEELNVSLGADAALIDGRFRFQPDDKKGMPWEGTGVRVTIPIWIPAKSSQGDQTVAPLLDVISKGGLNQRDSAALNAWNSAIAFKFTIGNREVPVSEYSVYAPTTRYARKMIPDHWLHDGWIVVCVSVDFPPKLLRGSPEVRIRYRQPLRKTKAGSEFVYVPEFDDMPKNLNTKDLKQYAMILKPDTGVSAWLGSIPIPSGHSARLPLSHHQAIKVTVSVP
jgi:hypothetical protein